VADSIEVLAVGVIAAAAAVSACPQAEHGALDFATSVT
jgi:hypothetical protein